MRCGRSTQDYQSERHGQGHAADRETETRVTNSDGETQETSRHGPTQKTQRRTTHRLRWNTEGGRTTINKSLNENIQRILNQRHKHWVITPSTVTKELFYSSYWGHFILACTNFLFLPHSKIKMHNLLSALVPSQVHTEPSDSVSCCHQMTKE